MGTVAGRERLVGVVSGGASVGFIVVRPLVSSSSDCAKTAALPPKQRLSAKQLRMAAYQAMLLAFR